MSKFKVGERYITLDGMLVTPAGETIEITAVNGGLVIYRNLSKNSTSNFGVGSIFSDNLKPIAVISEPTTYELHITCNDGKTTNAVYKENGKIVKREKAVCAPSDTFSFETGARMAFDRVFPKPITIASDFHPCATTQTAEDKPKFAKGDRVRANDNVHRYIRGVGTITTVDPCDCTFKYEVMFDEGLTLWCYTDSVEPYTEPVTAKPPIKVTRDMLVKLGACSSGLAEFDRKFPSGDGEFKAVCNATNDGNVHWLKGNEERIISMQDKPKQEPIKLYCFKNKTDVGVRDYSRDLTVGKVYEFDGHKVNYDGGYCSNFKDFDAWKRGDFGFASCLVPLVKRPAKVGDYILIIGKGCHAPELTVGEIHRIEIVRDNGNVVTDKENVFCAPYELDEFLILNGYAPEPEKVEPTYYSGKVVCVESHDCFTVGKIYTFVNGRVADNNGLERSSAGFKAKSIKDWNSSGFGDFTAKFIEYKGEQA